ncbi:FadR/GntR family transcriptional regulator [Nocardia sp. alder85J]|uniref:FadR/GntR family transcriptional regulator n=1 Tax=Nocardia sp. alder85J TaxID=2862949 RepID=UPI001CD1BA67|nr:FCD domain-containing protein [Nocardia sp. alder85J]MCX4098396.1 FCD domain-containing protein [Nocardia sp. alder85J]
MASAVESDPADGGHPRQSFAIGAGLLAGQVARHIEDTVISCGWPVGQSLGSETELRERYGVGRPVLREAVRLVEHHQVARMRRGPNGGLFVCAPDAEPATRAMVIYLEYVGTSVTDLLEARSLLEPVAAGLAADRLTEDEITILRAALADERAHLHGPESWAHDPVHTLLGRLSGNPVLHLFIDVLTRLTTRYARSSRASSAAEAAVAWQDSHAAHEAIGEAVIAGDAARAQIALTTHLHHLTTWVDSRRAHRRTRDPRAGFDSATEPRGKLAEVLAGRIHDDIAVRGWPVGAVLGSETELVARYGISRPALREAVRLLEYHSVARMRRGRGGGLIVTAPESQASVDTIALLLEYERVTADDFRIVRTALELGAVTRVAARLAGAGDEPAARLTAAAGGPCETSAQHPHRAGLFHSELATLAGNPVLALFLSVVIEVCHRHRGDGAPGASSITGEPGHTHHRILDAIRHGDTALARHRMRRHLDTLTH